MKRDEMLKAVFTTVFALLVGAMLPAGALCQEGEIVVTATGTVSTPPDLIRFEVDIHSEAKTAAEATRETAARYKAVQDALRVAGVPLEDAPTLRFSVSQTWETDEHGRHTKPKGFQSDHTIQIRLRDMDRVGPAVDAVAQAGARNVWRFEFTTTAHDSLRQVALELAVRRARVDAEAMARAAGGHLGPLLEVSTAEAVAAMGRRLSHDPDAMAMKVGIPTIGQPVEKVIQVTVLGRWRFQKEE